MNILFQTQVSPFSNQSVGGAETSIKLMASLFAERGNNVCWLSKSETNLPWFTTERKQFGKIRVYQYNKARGEGRVGFIEKYNKKRIDRLLSEIISQNKIDIVYCFYDINFIKTILTLRRSKGLSFKIVMRMAGLYWYEQCRLFPGMASEFQSVFNQIDAVNYIHPALEDMVQEKFAELNMNVDFKAKFYGDIGSPVSIVRSEPYRDLSNETFTMIMATRFSSYQKRQDLLVNAMALIDVSLPLKLTLIGNGSERQKISELIVSLGLSDRISIIPFVSQDELWTMMQHADLLCHACDYEGLSKIIIESMSIGLPVLASDVPPLNAYIIDEKNGYLVRNTPEAWASKIKQICGMKENRIAVSETSIGFIDENYNPNKNVVSYENFFRGLIGKQ